eukprot:5350721-Prymnesium_polylepis.1
MRNPPAAHLYKDRKPLRNLPSPGATTGPRPSIGCAHFVERHLRIIVLALGSQQRASPSVCSASRVSRSASLSLP